MGRAENQLFGVQAAEPVLADCAVAFADAMGISRRSSDPETAARFLQVMHAAQTDGRRFLHGEEYAFGLSSQWFSDNVCVSVPYDGWRSLSTVTRSVGVLAARFALEGVFLRGAVTVDLHYQSETVAFGPGLTQAARAEKDTFYPRIMMLDRASQIVHADAAGRIAPLAVDGDDQTLFVDFIQYLDEDLMELAEAIVAAGKEAVDIQDTRERTRAEEQVGWLEAYYTDATHRSPRSPKRRLKNVPGRFATITQIPRNTKARKE